MFRPFLLAGFALLAAVTSVAAHPHVWVAVRSEVLFDTSGKISGIRHTWTFDDMYSAFVTANLGDSGKDPTEAQLLPVAKMNVESLKEFGYFTVTKAGGKPLAYGAPKDYSIHYNAADKTATLVFTLPLAAPVSTGKAFVLQVYDSSYFVDFEFEKTDAIRLVGAPGGCSLSVLKPKPLAAAETAALSESFFSGLSPGTDFGIKLADRAIIACP